MHACSSECMDRCSFCQLGLPTCKGKKREKEKEKHVRICTCTKERLQPPATGRTAQQDANHRLSRLFLSRSPSPTSTRRRSPLLRLPSPTQFPSTQTQVVIITMSFQFSRPPRLPTFRSPPVSIKTTRGSLSCLETFP